MAIVKIEIRDDEVNNKVVGTFDFGKGIQSKKELTYAQEIGQFLHGAYNQFMREMDKRRKLGEMQEDTQKSKDTD